ncbi:hypothetical protein AWH62_06290 [Maricaulis sp. W15]|nr:hypothetical protein AWH62_06290 [Maricaulis sp. W15]
MNAIGATPPRQSFIMRNQKNHAAPPRSSCGELSKARAVGGAEMAVDEATARWQGIRESNRIRLTQRVGQGQKWR